MYESAPWRTELRKQAIVLRDVPSWPSEEIQFELERALFYSGVVLRKLMEDRKLTDEFCARTMLVPVHITVPTDKDSVHRNMPGSVEIDPVAHNQQEVPLAELCNQIIHFLMREWLLGEQDMAPSVVLSSYRHQDRYAYRLSLEDWANILEEAANSWPTQILMSEGKRWVK